MAVEEKGQSLPVARQVKLLFHGVAPSEKISLLPEQ
jgi:hypothetical protein